MTKAKLIFLTHAEVQIDPAQPVTDWPLSEQGRARHARFAESAAVSNVSAIFSSTERKAVEGAAPIARKKGIEPMALSALGENDRSATGYLPPDEFEATADRFFDAPDISIRGWETARAAHARIVAATRTLIELTRPAGDLLIVAHGAVGALLRCHLLGCGITRKEDQFPGGGCYFLAGLDLASPPTRWERI